MDADELAEAAALLDRIRVEPERRQGYDRDDWPHWSDEDRDCLDAREEVLVIESLTPAERSADGCSVLAELWRDLYTGEDYVTPRPSTWTTWWPSRRRTRAAAGNGTGNEGRPSPTTWRTRAP